MSLIFNPNSVFYTNVTRHKNKLLCRYIENGEEGQHEFKYNPTLFGHIRGDYDPALIKFRGLKNEPLLPITYDNMNSAREAIESAHNTPGMDVYGNDDYVSQFLGQSFKHDYKYNRKSIRGCNFDIEIASSYRDNNGDYRIERYRDRDKSDDDGIVVKKFDEDLVRAGEYPITAVTFHDSATDIYTVIGVEEEGCGGFVYDPDDPEIGGLNVVYHGFINEYDLLRYMVNYISSKKFHYFTGWNIIAFDVAYICTRIQKILGHDMLIKLSPFKKITARDREGKWGKEITEWTIHGCDVLSYDDLYIKFSYEMLRAYSLDYVGNYEVGIKKLSYKEHGSIDKMYFKSYQDFIRYNIKDVMNVNKIDEKRKLLNLAINIAYTTSCTYADTTGTIKPWNALLYKELLKEGRVPEIKEVFDGDTRFEGAYVKMVIRGKHYWVVAGDLNSLYPHIMQWMNMGPETIIEYEDLPPHIRTWAEGIEFDVVDLLMEKVDLSILKGTGICMSPNKQFFWREDKVGRSVFNQKTRELYARRKDIKKMAKGFEQELIKHKANQPHPESLERAEWDREEIRIWEEVAHDLGDLISEHDGGQMAIKILMNSLYGACGLKFFKSYYDVRIAEGITMSAQLANRWMWKSVNTFLNEYLDTSNHDYVKPRFEGEKPGAEYGYPWEKGVDYCIAGDTDSGYYELLPIVIKHGFDPYDLDMDNVVKITKFLDEFWEENIQPVIEAGYEKLSEYLNCYENRMFVEREVIAPVCIWQAKKFYTMLISKNENVEYFDKLKLKYMGVSAKKSSTPEWAVDHLVKMYDICMRSNNESEIFKFITDTRAEFDKMEIHDIGIPTGINKLDEYDNEEEFTEEFTDDGGMFELSADADLWKKGAQRHVKAVLAHNKVVNDMDLPIAEIRPGSKIMYVYLKPNNPINFEVIAFNGFMDERFKLNDYIDRRRLWEEGFIRHAQIFLDVMGWKTEGVDVEDVFAQMGFDLY